MTVFRDLAQHLLDIYENGVKAGAEVIHVEIEEDLADDRLALGVRDDGHGMAPEMLRRSADPWMTTRTTRRVGLGIPFLKQTAEMCGGSFEIESAPGEGTEIRAIFQHRHIDRPPLGDMVATLTCMIVGYPKVGLVYRHRVDGAEFSFDTREIREVLGDDVPFSDPEVLGFLRSMLEEGLAALGRR